MALRLRNSSGDIEDEDEEDGDAIDDNSTLELAKEEFCIWPMHSFTQEHSQTILYLIKVLVSSGGNIYAVNSMGHSPFSQVKQIPELKAEMVYLTRWSLLLFFEAVRVSDDLTNSCSFQRVAESTDMGRHIVGFL